MIDWGDSKWVEPGSRSRSVAHEVTPLGDGADVRSAPCPVPGAGFEPMSRQVDLGAQVAGCGCAVAGALSLLGFGVLVGVALW